MEPQINRGPERLIHGRENLIYLPLKDDGYPSLPIYLIKTFKPNLYAQNHRLIGVAEQFYKTIGTTAHKAFKRGINPITSVKPEQATQIVDETSNSHNSTVTFRNLIGEYEMDNINYDNLQSTLDEQFTNMTDRSCIMSTSHVTDFHMVDHMVKMGVDLSKVGIIVVDQHIDSGTSNNPKGQFMLDKSNFLLPILDRGIGAVSIIGIDEEDIPRVKNEVDTITSVPDDGRLQDSFKEIRTGLSELQDFYIKYKDRVNLAPGVFGESRKMAKSKKVVEYVRKQIEFMKAKGIEQIIISFDMDSLDMMKEKITAPPYSPYAALILLGMQDFTQILNAAGVEENEFEDGVRHLMKLRLEIDALKQIRKKKGLLSIKENNLLDDKQKQFGSQITSVYPIINQMEAALQSLTCPAKTNTQYDLFLESFRGAHIITSDEGGFTVDQAEFLIQTIKSETEAQGLQNGVQLPNGRIMGSVSELDGPDIGEYSASAALKLVNAISA